MGKPRSGVFGVSVLVDGVVDAVGICVHVVLTNVSSVGGVFQNHWGSFSEHLGVIAVFTVE